MKTLNYAVVGLGIGSAHCDAVLRFEEALGVRLAAVCDLRQDRLDQIAKKSPSTKLYTDFDLMLENEDIDILSVCTPSGMHAEMAIKAADKKINLLVEKPIDITREAASALVEAARRNGIVAGICHQNRKNAVIAKIREAIDEGRFGKLNFGTFSVKWHRDQSYYDGWHGTWNMDGGGSLINQGIHTLDLMRTFFGEPVTVSSEARIYTHDIETEDFTASLFTFEGGEVATLLTTTSAYPGICTEIALYGTDGTVELDGDVLKTWSFKDRDDKDKMLSVYGSGNIGAKRRDPSLITDHAAMVYDIIDAVRNGRSAAVSLEEGEKSLGLVLDIYENAYGKKKG